MSYIKSFIKLFFPKVCSVCGRGLYSHESLICTLCKNDLPFTNFHLINKNPVEMTFWGRTEIKKATSLLLYSKGEKTKHILHSIKYRGNIALAEEMGKMLAKNLLDIDLFHSIDYIIPVPLHPAKFNKRGYNQSEIISNGISKITNIPVENHVLFKTINTSTQTKKNRYERWKNAEEIYEIRNSNQISGKNILLVDDVLTTGATLESCALALHSAEISSLNIVTLAYAAN